MPRHAKNNTAGPTLTYGERKKLKHWGTKTVRLGGDSLKDFDACSLCLHQAVDPLICPQGHLFCKGCIFECLLTQKQYTKTQQKLYDEQQLEKKNEETQKELEQKKKEIDKFEKQESGIQATTVQKLKKPSTNNETKTTKPIAGYDSYSTPQGKEVFMLDKDSVRSNLAADSSKLTPEQQDMRKQLMPCFWIPNLTPFAGKTSVSRPSNKTSCPAGQHLLRLKQLRPIHFQQLDEKERARVSQKKDHMSNNAKYMCGSCDRTLTNSTVIGIISKCGHGQCARCIDELVKQDRVCPQCGVPCPKAKDIIVLQHGSTSFAAAGAGTAIAKLTPSFQG